ncbi:hypothetical protein G6F32_017516 [Rhizopus arrhizus]|nr:hypothetical protein G6F32_017516 [Rhizopus arrhizus]
MTDQAGGRGDLMVAHAGQWFVQQQDARIGQQSQTQFQRTLQPIRQRAGDRVSPGRKICQFEHGVDGGGQPAVVA